MRSAGLVVIAVVAACDFQKNPAVPDGPVDGKLDGPPDMMLASYTVDAVSHIATPRNAAEWGGFLAQKGLTIMPPNGLWLMGEPGGQLDDSIGMVAIPAMGNPMYQLPVTGWQRRGVATGDNQNNYFADRNDVMLPDISQRSMMILAYYACTATPGGTRTVLLAGSGTSASIAEVKIDMAGKLSIVANGVSATSASSYDSGSVTPIVLRLFHSSTAPTQTLFTKTEVVNVSPGQALQSGVGIFVGDGSSPPPPGVWLYMAAWYGPAAEMTDPQVNGLLSALGF